MRRYRLTSDQAEEVLSLRKLGMTSSDVVIAMQYFRGDHVTRHQVEYLSRLSGTGRGQRPSHALRKVTA